MDAYSTSQEFVGKRPKSVVAGIIKTGKVRKDRPKRTLITAACEECRLRKAKCCGGRPSCSRCLRGKKACIYSVNPGETRQAAARTKTESLQKEYDSMLEIIDSLRSKPLSDAEGLFRSLRECEDSTKFLKTFRTLSKSNTPSTSMSSSDRSSESVQRRCSSSEPSSGSSQTSAPSLGPGTPLISEQSWRNSDTATELLPTDLGLPTEHVLRDIVRQFYHSSGKLFHVLDQQVIERHLDDLYQAQTPSLSKRALCELCCVAAVGVLYMKDTCEARDVFYDISRALLGDAMQETPIQAAKCCVLLGLFNIMSKATVALAYIELGMDLCRRHRLHAPIATEAHESSVGDWIDGKRTWRTLLFLGSWISATLGYISSNDWMFSEISSQDIEIEGETEIGDLVQTEMVKIAMLKQGILRINSSSETVSTLPVESVREGLHKWHQDLPEVMRLTNLLNNPGIPTDVRVSIYTVHLLYLGALMLIYRQILNNPQHSANDRAFNLERAHTDAVTAAQQSSRIFNLLRQDNGVHQRCWLSIFQSYCASVLILHGVAQDLTNSSGQASSHLDNLEQARRCLDILEFCGEVDPIAINFHDVLHPFYETLRVVATSPQPHYTFNLRLQSVCAELFNLVRRPFGQIGHSQSVTGWSSRQYEDRKISSATDQSPAFPDTSNFGWQALDPVRSEGTVNALMSSLKPARFLDGFMPHGWAGHAKVPR